MSRKTDLFRMNSPAARRAGRTISAAILACGILLLPNWLGTSAADDYHELFFPQAELARMIYTAQQNPTQPDFSGLSLGASDPALGQSGVSGEVAQAAIDYLQAQMQGLLFLQTMQLENGCVVHLAHDLEANLLHVFAVSLQDSTHTLAIGVEDMPVDVDQALYTLSHPEPAEPEWERPPPQNDEDSPSGPPPLGASGIGGYLPSEEINDGEFVDEEQRFPGEPDDLEERFPHADIDAPRETAPNNSRERQPVFRLAAQSEQQGADQARIDFEGPCLAAVQLQLGMLDAGPLSPATRAITVELFTNGGTPSSIRFFAGGDVGLASPGITYSGDNNHNSYHSIAAGEVITIKRGSGANQRMDIEFRNSQPVTIRSMNLTAVNQDGDEITLRAQRTGATLNVRTTAANEPAINARCNLRMEGNGTLNASSSQTNCIYATAGNGFCYMRVTKNFKLIAVGKVYGIYTDMFTANGADGHVTVDTEGKVGDPGELKTPEGIYSLWDINITSATVKGKTVGLNNAGGLYANRDIYVYSGGIADGRSEGANCAGVHANNILYVNGGTVTAHVRGASSNAVLANQGLIVRSGGKVSGYAHNASGSSGVYTKNLSAGGVGTVLGDGGGNNARAGIRIHAEGEFYAYDNALVEGKNAQAGILTPRLIAMGGSKSYGGASSVSDTGKTRVVGQGTIGIQTNFADAGELLCGGGAVVVGTGQTYGIQCGKLVQAALSANSQTQRPAIQYNLSTLRYGTIYAVAEPSDGIGFRQNTNTVASVDHGIRLVARGGKRGMDGSDTLQVSASNSGELVAVGDTIGIWTNSVTAGANGKIYARGGSYGIYTRGANCKVGTQAASGQLTAMGGIADSNMTVKNYTYPAGFTFNNLPVPVFGWDNIPTPVSGTQGAYIAGGDLVASGTQSRGLYFGGEYGVAGTQKVVARNGAFVQALGGSRGITLSQGVEATGGAVVRAAGEVYGVRASQASVSGQNSYLYGKGLDNGISTTGAVSCAAGSSIVGETVAAVDATEARLQSSAISAGSITADGLVHELYQTSPFTIATPPAYALNLRLQALGSNVGSDPACLQNLTWTTPQNHPAISPDARDWLDYDPNDGQDMVTAEEGGLIALKNAQGVTLVGNSSTAGAVSGTGGRLHGSGTYRITMRNVDLAVLSGDLTVKVVSTGLWHGHDTAVFLIQLQGVSGAATGRVYYDYIAMSGSADYDQYRTTLLQGETTFVGIPSGKYRVTAFPTLRSTPAQSKEVVLVLQATAEFAFETPQQSWLTGADVTKNKVVIDPVS